VLNLAGPELQILGPLLWLFVDSAGYLRGFAAANAYCLRSSSVIWTCFVTIKCPNDHSPGDH
jgi:hypothetical protein